MIETTYKVGMYIRLSREDEDKGNESESITNQRSFILDFIKENNYTLYDEYVDDGYSGTTFDRPAFKRMIADIEKSKINMVITKDMSRLGRDYVNFGHYIEKYFPEHNVRYIAITDDVDTAIDSIGNDMVPFKAIFNDMYAKDISKKIKASITTKKKQGLFMGAHAPYGYNKDLKDKHKLVIDPVASLVVKRIYKLYLEGNSLRRIAETLTNEKVPKPSIHKKMNYQYPYNDKTKDVWEERTLYDILRNPNYTGNLFQNRRKKVNYKSKKIINVSKEKWITAYNTHEAIIDMDTYERAQSINDKNKLHHKTSERNILLQGFMKCKECGHTIGINTSGDKTRHYTICNHYRKYPKQHFCTCHSMRYEIIEDIVLKDVKRMYKEAIDTKKLETIMKNNSKRTKALADITDRISIAKKVIEDNTKYLHNSYMDKLKGIITYEMYQEVTDKLSEEININKKLIEELGIEKQGLEDNQLYTDKEYKKVVREYLSLKKPNRALLSNIIDKITIDENKDIEIHYKVKPILR
ncbi:MAG: recombinase family protein [Bacilli bacterium]|nr:recombinase family protein [Bacilli bacterium]